MKISLVLAVLAGAGVMGVVSPAAAEKTGPSLSDKTLVAWAAPANLTQKGGSVLTIAGKTEFTTPWDGIVFGEIAPAKWMAGSEFYHRTERRQAAWPAETADANTLVQIAIVYQGNGVTTFRDGREYSRQTGANPLSFGADSVVVIGPRHPGSAAFFAGAVDDARIYDRALTAAELAALKPNVGGAIPPWAWWTFDDAAAKDRTGRFAHTQLTAGAKVENGKLILDGLGGSFLAARRAELLPAVAVTLTQPAATTVPEELVLNYHLMHPGGDSFPGDPNAAFYLDGVYHLHYILQHLWQGKRSFALIHVTSPDMLHWTWQKTELQPAFTGHGMFSGTGFITKDGKPAAIYHGQGSGRNQIAIAKDNRLSAWEKPYPIAVNGADGKELKLGYWDPDCFLIGDTYYAISGGNTQPLLKSKDLKHWTYVGEFLKHDLPDVVIGEDISCGNFFPLGKKWMLLCISHSLGCRYYLGDWDAKAEQFVPEKHARMNWRHEEQTLGEAWRDVFAPESVLTPDGRRVMWAWLVTLDKAVSSRTIQSLPRELSLPADGSLRLKPLRELESLRADPVALGNVVVRPGVNARTGGADWRHLTDLPGDSLELRLTIPRDQAERKRFGFRLFSDGRGVGLPIILRPETGTIRVGTTEAPFAVADLPAGEDVQLRIFVDKYLVEVFANDRQAVVATCMDWRGKAGLDGYSFGAPTTVKKLEIWKLKPANQGFREAQTNQIWQPDSGKP